MKVLVTHLCPILWDSMHCNPQDSSVHGILQARILVWVFISSSKGSSQLRDQTHILSLHCIAILLHCRGILYPLSHLGRLLLLLSHFSHVGLCATPETAAYQAPPSLGFSRQEHWSGLPCPPPGDLPNPRIEPRSPTLQVDSLPAEPQGKPSTKNWEKNILLL